MWLSHPSQQHLVHPHILHFISLRQRLIYIRRSPGVRDVCLSAATATKTNPTTRRPLLVESTTSALFTFTKSVEKTRIDMKVSVDYLKGLNAAQLEAVQHPPHIPLQILAGPGSGKTKVLTSRIAHLVTVHSIPPTSICAVTFTNKAANEMRERLEKLVGNHVTSQIKLGTFHALCAMFLRKHATLIGIGRNFTVCDADESKRVVAKLLKPYSDYLEERNVTLKETAIMSRISKAKTKGLTPVDLADAHLKADPKSSVLTRNKVDTLEPSQVIASVVGEVYQRYEKELKRSNSLDFDDLLVYGVRLFRDHPHVNKWCRHLLVDEFQDTNVVQYQLMTYIAGASRLWVAFSRNGELSTHAKSSTDFPSTQQVYLEQNYRSTAAILSASVAIISQDKSRIPKTLHTSHSNGPLPVLHSFPSEQDEASAIATEVKRMIAHSGGMLSYKDFAILLRMNSLSRAIEGALQAEGIPHTVLGGHRFFERMEVKDLVAYLQVVDNPQFVPAFVRVINVPSRAIGDKTVAEILARAEKLQVTPLEVVERIHDGKLPDIKPPVKRKASSFVEVIRVLRKMAVEGAKPGALATKLIELIEYQEHLKKHHDDWESRWDNVEELVNFASEFRYVPTVASGANSPAVAWGKGQDTAEEDDWMDDVDDEDTIVPPSEIDTPLRAFLQASMLSTDTEGGKDDPAQHDRVIIATCHAAKGLEWPVVFIPAVEKGVFPSSRAEDIEEERRLLYVACTRAQGLLYMSYCTSRMAAGTVKRSILSEFMTALSEDDEGLLQHCMPELTDDDRQILATVLRRAPPSDAMLQQLLNEYRMRSKPSEWSFAAAESEIDSFYSVKPFPGTGNTFRERSQEPVPIPNQPFATFTSAKNSMPLDYPKPSSTSKVTPLGTSRPGANAPRGPPAAAKPHKKDLAQPNLSSYMKPRSSNLELSKHPTRRLAKESSMPMPDVSVGNDGVYSSTLAKSRAKQPIANQNLAPSNPTPSSNAPMNLGRSKTNVTPPVQTPLPSSSVQKVNNKVNIPAGREESKPSGPSMATTAVAGTKRRLGMRGPVVGYTNKKFKPPTR
ncbi:hypothetical protein NM688_g5299 [Phlebia brevispora]|uniref:Uncharacterized protein n=1 Tax=Phlebia brevispora TaxID=194682 RepID=A0ACC1SXM9_9APHY|nr:hypothetical protein NM688_g5299 [Phlebia brevispora]